MMQSKPKLKDENRKINTKGNYKTFNFHIFKSYTILNIEYK